MAKRKSKKNSCPDLVGQLRLDKFPTVDKLERPKRQAMAKLERALDGMDLKSNARCELERDLLCKADRWFLNEWIRRQHGTHDLTLQDYLPPEEARDVAAMFVRLRNRANASQATWSDLDLKEKDRARKMLSRRRARGMPSELNPTMIQELVATIEKHSGTQVGISRSSQNDFKPSGPSFNLLMAVIGLVMRWHPKKKKRKTQKRGTAVAAETVVSAVKKLKAVSATTQKPTKARQPARRKRKETTLDKFLRSRPRSLP